MAAVTDPDRTIQSTSQSSSCCSTFYEQDWVRHLAEDIFHPGGEELSNKTVAAMNLPAGAAIADLGCGTGTTAMMLAPWTCLADAVDEEAYLKMFAAAGFEIQAMADESASLTSLIRMLKRKLLMLGAGALANGTAPDSSQVDFDLASIKFWLDRFATEVEKGTIRYLSFNLQCAG